MARREQVLKYLTPDIPADELDRYQRSFCIPNDPRWLGNFMGAIEPLTHAENWELKGSVTPEQAAAVFQTIFDDAFYGLAGDCETMACCPIRYTEEGGVEQFNEDTNEWEQAAYPPLPVRVPVEGQDNACLAAANATEVISALWVNWKNIWDGATLLVAATNLIAVIALLIFFPPAGVVYLAIVGELFNLMTLIGTDDFDSDDEAVLQCILFCAARVDGEIVTFDYSEVIREVNELWNPISDINVWGGIWYLISIIAEDGLNRAGTTTSITSADCDDCDDCPPPQWCYDIDFALTDGDFEPRIAGLHDWGGVWTLGSGWNNTNSTSLNIRRQLPIDVHVTSLGFSSASGLGAVAVACYQNADFTGTQYFRVDAVETGDIDVLCPAGSWIVCINGSSSEYPDQFARNMNFLHIQGTGEEPWGASSC